MQATEALQRVLARAAKTIELKQSGGQIVEAIMDPDQEAIAFCQKILNTAVPLARFRCYVTVEKIGQKSKLGLGDFTTCGLTISSIKNGIIGLSMEQVEIYLRLWEHRDDGGMDMLTGYQGPSKSLAFRTFLKDIDRFERDPSTPTNNIQVNNGPSA